jgi:hypothetical protein
MPLESYAPITRAYWYPVLSRTPNRAGVAPIGEQDTDQTFDDWRPGYQESGNELSLALLAGYQFGIRREGSSIQMRTAFTVFKQNINLIIAGIKGPIRKIKKPVGILS